MKNKILFILCGFLFTQESSAVIRVVGNGGGYAEMQAVLINSQISQLVAICEPVENPCSLSLGEWSLVKNSMKDPLEVGFSPECFQNPITVLNSNSILISSCHLYTDGTYLAQNYSHIASLVLSGHLMSRVGVGFENAFKIAQNIFSGFTQTDLSYSVLTSLSEVQLHSLKVQNQVSLVSIISIEGPMKSVDLTPYFIRNASCEVDAGKIEILRFNSFQEIGDDRLSVDMRVRYRCENKRQYEASAMLFVSLDENGEVSEQDIVVRFMDITPVLE